MQITLFTISHWVFLLNNIYTWGQHMNHVLFICRVYIVYDQSHGCDIDMAHTARIGCAQFPRCLRPATGFWHLYIFQWYYWPYCILLFSALNWNTDYFFSRKSVIKDIKTNLPIKAWPIFGIFCFTWHVLSVIICIYFCKIITNYLTITVLSTHCKK